LESFTNYGGGGAGVWGNYFFYDTGIFILFFSPSPHLAQDGEKKRGPADFSLCFLFARLLGRSTAEVFVDPIPIIAKVFYGHSKSVGAPV